MKIAFVLPGLHMVNRGAEAAFECIARELAMMPDTEVTLIGSGQPRSDTPYNFIHAGCTPREKFRKWPSIPLFRSEYRYEEFTFARNLKSVYHPDEYDAVITCSYPFVHWALKRSRNGKRPARIFVTENGDWAPRRINMEYRFFNCDGLVCTNPEYFRRHEETFNCALMPNGIHVDNFRPGPDMREELGLPADKPLVLMVSAMIASKYPVEGIRAAAGIPGASLVIAGDGPLREECDRVGKELLGDRYKVVSFPAEKMPDLYRSADVMLHMSRGEAFGNIYIEAAACGTPVVSHDYETPRWILEDLGIFVDSDNIEAVTEALLQAVNQDAPENPEAIHEELSNRFSWPIVAKQYHEFLTKTISESGK